MSSTTLTDVDVTVMVRLCIDIAATNADVQLYCYFYLLEQLWRCIMNSVEWNKKEELVAEQALKHLKVMCVCVCVYVSLSNVKA